MMVYTPKQRELMQLWQDGGLRRINILSGSVRSGKTWISLVLWAFWVASMPKDCCYLMCAKTLTSLRRNALDLLQSLVGTNHFTYSIPAKEGRLFGRQIYLEGGNDARAESKIRGMTLAGGYVDELTQLPEDFFIMLLSRLSEPGAKVFATTNPDAPTHWVKKNFLDRESELDLLSVKYLLDDNTFLDPEYVANLKKEFVGVYFERFVNGNWVLADGLIYPHAREAIVPTEDRPYTEYQVAADYGIHNPTCFGLFGKAGGAWYMVKEYRHSGRESNKLKTDEDYVQDLITFIGGLPIKRVLVDPSASSFIVLARRKAGVPIIEADNAVLDGIRNTATALRIGALKINDCCTHAINEFDSYSWDAKAGEDKPIKEHDHLMDLVRYFVQWNRSIILPPRQNLVKLMEGR